MVSECGRAGSGVEQSCTRRPGSACEEVEARFWLVLAFARGLAFDGSEDTAGKQATRGEEEGGREGGGDVTGSGILIDQLIKRSINSLLQGCRHSCSSSHT